MCVLSGQEAVICRAGKQAIKVAAVMWRKANNTTTLKIDLLSEQVMMLCEFLHGRASEEHQHILRDVLILSKPDYDQRYTDIDTPHD